MSKDEYKNKIESVIILLMQNHHEMMFHMYSMKTHEGLSKECCSVVDNILKDYPDLEYLTKTPGSKT